MMLNEWVKSFPIAEVIGETDLEIQAIVSDYRKATPGALFVALTGSKEEGRRFISEAIDRGAVAVVTEGTIREESSTAKRAATFLRVQDSRQALAHLASSFWGDPTDRLRLIGVTGTNGKTTTAFLIRSLLQAAGLKTGLLGTIHYDLGGRLLPATQTTPGLLELRQLLVGMREKGLTDAVMEVSSHALDQGRVAGLRFDAAVFTNLTQDHLDYHGTLEAYFAAKRRLFDQVDPSEGRGVVNIDDPWGARLRSEIPGRSWGYGIERRGEIYPTSILSDLNGTRMRVETPLGPIDVSSPLLGRYNAYNLLAAIGVGATLGLSGEAIGAGLSAMKEVPGRFERIDLGQDFNVIVDYAHTEDALSRLLQAVSDLSPRRIITVFGCGGDRDRGKRSKMGAVSARLSDRTFLTSDNPRSESPLSIIQEIEAGLRSEDASADYEIIPNRREAIDLAIALAERGDAVVVAGKGHEYYQIIGAERLPFDDREVARAALAKRRREG